MHCKCLVLTVALKPFDEFMTATDLQLAFSNFNIHKKHHTNRYLITCFQISIGNPKLQSDPLQVPLQSNTTVIKICTYRVKVGEPTLHTHILHYVKLS